MVWRRILGLDSQTAQERRAALNGVSMFFGALIGANLGSSDQLSIPDYALMIAVICLIVLYIHVAPVARKRWTALATLSALLGGLYLLLVHEIGTHAFDGARPSPHIFVTICFWLVSVAAVEFRPAAPPLPDRRR